MKRTHLIQRLTAPRGAMKLAGKELKDSPFSFGGGLKNGGLGDKAMDTIRKVFAFDYMGASEYEWGAVPEALTFVLEAREKKNLVADVIGIQLRDVEKPYDLDGRKSGKKGGKKDIEIDYTQSMPVYIICQKDHVSEVYDRIRKAAAGDLGERDGTQLPRVLYRDYLAKVNAYLSCTCGWLELNNGFFFTTDKTMFDGLCQLFQLEAASQPKEV